MENIKHTKNNSFEKTREELTRHQKCPTCGATRARYEIMNHFEDELVQFIRENRLVKRASGVMYCVPKHLRSSKGFV